MVGNLTTLGVDILVADQTIYNEQVVRGAVIITDGRKLYNYQRVIPCSSRGGGSVLPPLGYAFVIQNNKIAMQSGKPVVRKVA